MCTPKNVPRLSSATACRSHRPAIGRKRHRAGAVGGVERDGPAHGSPGRREQDRPVHLRDLDPRAAGHRLDLELDVRDEGPVDVGRGDRVRQRERRSLRDRDPRAVLAVDPRQVPLRDPSARRRSSTAAPASSVRSTSARAGPEASSSHTGSPSATEKSRSTPARRILPLSVDATPSTSGVVSRTPVTDTSPGPALVTRTCTTRCAHVLRPCRTSTLIPASTSVGIGVAVGARLTGRCTRATTSATTTTAATRHRPAIPRWCRRRTSDEAFRPQRPHFAGPDPILRGRPGGASAARGGQVAAHHEVVSATPRSTGCCSTTTANPCASKNGRAVRLAWVLSSTAPSSRAVRHRPPQQRRRHPPPGERGVDEEHVDVAALVDVREPGHASRRPPRPGCATPGAGHPTRRGRSRRSPRRRPAPACSRGRRSPGSRAGTRRASRGRRTRA